MWCFSIQSTQCCVKEMAESMDWASFSGNSVNGIGLNNYISSVKPLFPC